MHGFIGIEHVCKVQIKNSSHPFPAHPVLALVQYNSMLPFSTLL